MIAIVLGLVVGITGQYYLFLGFFSLIPWGLAGLALGCFCKGKANAALAGSLYGFVLSFSFMTAGYTGNASLLSRLPFFALLGLFGAVCGLLAALVGFLIKNSLVKQRSKD